MSEPFQEEVQCARCGSSVDRRVCWKCGGEGVDGHECGEDCCACLYPEDNVPCDICMGEGGWDVCLSDAAWCNAHPRPGRENVPRGNVEYFKVSRSVP